MTTRQLGRFTLIDRIAIGSLGEVWRASDAGNVVAVKRLLPHFEEDEAARLTLAEDAQNMGSLQHRNIVRLDEFVIDENFVAMEYVAGRDLKRVVEALKSRGQRMPVELAAFVVAQLADALEHAHANSTVSHGLSPHHVVLSWTGDVKLVGFGSGRAAVRRPGEGIKPAFASMSPEQVRGRKLDGRSDVFALGTILYELLTGASAFESESEFSTLERVRNAEFEPPTTRDPQLPAELASIVVTALAKDPDHRFQTAAALGEGLWQFLRSREAMPQDTDLAAFLASTFPGGVAKAPGFDSTSAPAHASDAQLATTALRTRQVTLSQSNVHFIDEGEGPPVLLLHGNPDSSELWEPVIRLLPNTRCIAPDLPGFGRSTFSPKYDTSLDGMAAFVDEFVAAAGITGLLHLAVHDVGGPYGLAWAVKHPERVQSLLITNTIFHADYTWHTFAKLYRTPIVGELVQLLTTKRGFGRELRRGSRRLTRQQIESTWDRLGPTTGRMVLRWYRSMDPRRFAGWQEQLQTLVAARPSSVVWGRHDPYIGTEYAQRFNARTVDVEDCGHWVPAEAPELVAQRIRELIAAG